MVKRFFLFTDVMLSQRLTADVNSALECLHHVDVGTFVSTWRKYPRHELAFSCLSSKVYVRTEGMPAD
jgi:hypothetical protein